MNFDKNKRIKMSVAAEDVVYFGGLFYEFKDKFRF